MKLFVLFAQRKESYEGEYAPEALHCIDECGDDGNPSFLRDMKAEAINSGEYSSVEVVTLTFDGNEVYSILHPAKNPIAATVTKARGEQP